MDNSILCLKFMSIIFVDRLMYKLIFSIILPLSMIFVYGLCKLKSKRRRQRIFYEVPHYDIPQSPDEMLYRNPRSAKEILGHSIHKNKKRKATKYETIGLDQIYQAIMHKFELADNLFKDGTEENKLLKRALEFEKKVIVDENFFEICNDKPFPIDHYRELLEDHKRILSNEDLKNPLPQVPMNSSETSSPRT